MGTGSEPGCTDPGLRLLLLPRSVFPAVFEQGGKTAGNLPSGEQSFFHDGKDP